MAYYSDIITDAQTKAPRAEVSVTVLKNGDKATIRDDAGYELENPVISDELGFFSFNAVDDIYNFEYRYNGRLFRQDEVTVGAPAVSQPYDPSVPGPPGSTSQAIREIVATDFITLSLALAIAAVSGARTKIKAIGTIDFFSTLTNQTPNVFIEGEGSDMSHDIGTLGSEARTKFVWRGAAGGTFFKWQAASGAAKQKAFGGGLSNIYFDGNTVAGVGIEIRSWYGGRFEQLHFNNVRTAGFSVGIVTSLGEARDSQFNVFRLCSSRHYETPGGTGSLMVMDGGAAAPNVSLNRIELCDTYIVNSPGFDLGNCDSNIFEQIRVNRLPGGTGPAMLFRGSDTSADYVARDNTVKHLSAFGGIPVLCRGTTTNTYPTTNNTFHYLDSGNSTAVPTFETGSTGSYSTTGGVHGGFPSYPIQGLAVGEVAFSAGLAQTRRAATTSILAVNGSDDHIRLETASGTAVWRMNVPTVSGDLNIFKTAGSGSLYLDGRRVDAPQAWAPTITASSGTFGSLVVDTGNSRFSRINGIVTATVVFQLVTLGTATGVFIVNGLPGTPVRCVAVGGQDLTIGAALTGGGITTAPRVSLYNGATPFVAGHYYYVTLNYEVA